MSFQTHEQHGLVFLTSSLLEGVVHGFSTRKGGVSAPPWDSLNLRTGCGDAQTDLEENYRRFCGAVGADVERVVLARQVHETTVRPCTGDDAGKGLWRPRDYDADGLVTGEAGLPLMVFSADCGVILLHDPVHGAVGAVHAGWRGCAGGILAKAVREMTARFGSRPGDLLAAIGPCIGPCCFETDGDVPAAMRLPWAATPRPISPGKTPSGTRTWPDSTASGCCGPDWRQSTSMCAASAPPAGRTSSGPTARWARPGRPGRSDRPEE